jgi:hypothetical protein
VTLSLANHEASLPVAYRLYLPEDCDEELADWRAGRNAIYQLAALTVGVRLAVADG